MPDELDELLFGQRVENTGSDQAALADSAADLVGVNAAAVIADIDEDVIAAVGRFEADAANFGFAAASAAPWPIRCRGRSNCERDG